MLCDLGRWPDFPQGIPYPVDETIQQIRKMPISRVDQDALIAVLQTGELPSDDYSKAAAIGL